MEHDERRSPLFGCSVSPRERRQPVPGRPLLFASRRFEEQSVSRLAIPFIGSGSITSAANGGGEAFIVNCVGDVGLSIAIMLMFYHVDHPALVPPTR